MKNLIKKIKDYEIKDKTFDRLYYTLLFLIILLVVLLISSNNVDDKEQKYKELNSFNSSQYQSIHKDYKNTVKATVPILLFAEKENLFKPNQLVGGNGTAFFISPKHLLTNAHNLEVDDGYKFINNKLLINGGYFNIEVIMKDRRSDIALIKILGDYSSDYYIRKCQSDLRIGEEIYSFGHGTPFNKHGSIKRGYKNTSNQAYELEGNWYNQSNSIVNIAARPGDSGSAVISKERDCFANIINGGGNYSEITSAVSYHNINKFLDEVILYIKSK